MAYTIYCGWALCSRHWEDTDEIPDHVPPQYILGIIDEMNDVHLSGDTSLEGALSRRGLSKQPPATP